jgi:hypothetical protein
MLPDIAQRRTQRSQAASRTYSAMPEVSSISAPNTSTLYTGCTQEYVLTGVPRFIAACEASALAARGSCQVCSTWSQC